MKRLTINRIASAGLRANRKSYLALAAGIFLSIFLVTTLCLCVDGLLARREAMVAESVGYADVVLYDKPATHDQLMQTGYFSQMTELYVTGMVQDSTVAIGYDSPEGAAMLNRRITEGRMPEHAGEIALEPSVLSKLRMEAGIGENVTLAIIPVDGTVETRTYTIVGFLAEQSEALLDESWGHGPNRYPVASILVSAQEPAFATGRTVIHRLAVLRPGMTLARFLNDWNWEPQDDAFIEIKFGGANTGLNNQGMAVFFPQDAIMADAKLESQLLLLGILLGSLIVACCVGISSSMEATLSRKREEIAMLRAVGATRRQIRKVFGRETWLLALTLAPIAVLAGCGAACAAAALAADVLLFRLNPWVILPVIVLSVAVMLLSSMLPLRRASAVVPLMVMRDTGLMRHVNRISTKKAFKPARLIANRQLMLHPLRPVGAALMAAVMLLVICLGAGLTFFAADIEAPMADFTLKGNGGYGVRFLDSFDHMTLTRSDLQQLASLPGVTGVQPRRALVVNILLDTVPDYLKPSMQSIGNQHLLTDEDWDRYTSTPNSIYEGFDMREYFRADYAKAREQFGVTQEMAIFTVRVLPVDEAALAPFVVEGSIDMAAINAGEAVIAYVPTEYGATTDGSAWSTYKKPDDSIQLDYVHQNDFFHAGQTLTLMQNYYGLGAGEQGLPDDYERCESITLSVDVCAVIECQTPAYPHIHGGFLLTTEEGAHKMGLYVGRLNSVDITVDGSVTGQTEEALQKRITTIAQRGGFTVVNNTAEARAEQAAARRLITVLAGAGVVFFAIAAAMITGSVSRQIRADQRGLGTLRAVGADDKVLFHCYQGQVILSVLLAIPLAAIGVSAICLGGFVEYLHPGAIVVSILCAALLLVCCLISLRSRIRGVLKCSIVENIREM